MAMRRKVKWRKRKINKVVMGELNRTAVDIVIISSITKNRRIKNLSWIIRITLLLVQSFKPDISIS